MESDMRAVVENLSGVVREIAAMGGDFAGAGELRGDCLRLARKVSLLSHLLDEVKDFVAARAGDATAVDAADKAASSSSGAVDPMGRLEELLVALEAAKRLLLIARSAPPPGSDNAVTDMASKSFAVQFQYMTWLLEKVLEELPYEYFEISDEVQEQVDLVRAQLRRGMEKKGTPDVRIFSEIHEVLYHLDTDVRQQSPSKSEPSHKGTRDDHSDFQEIVVLVTEINGKSVLDAEKITSDLIERLEKAKITTSLKSAGDDTKTSDAVEKTTEEDKKPESLVIPEDFRCPISLELMRDPVIVSTGQTYERAFIQRWIDCGNRTCPKTQQKLQNLTLTPNYVLRSLIMQWCEDNKIEQPCRPLGGWIRKSDGSFHEVSGDRAAIDALIRNLSSRSLDERKSAAAEIRSLAKRSTDNRILLAEAGAIPALVNLLSVKDSKTQEHAVTALLNLSIYDHNKELIVLAGAILPVIQVLRMGSMEARENAAAAIFSLSLIDENKITIGSTPGAMDALVELLHSGSSRGRKDAATALFNLCIYQANKVRAVRAGILSPLVQMLQDSSSNVMVDEALTILSVLVSHQDCRVAITKANTIPLLIDLLRAGQPRNKENAAAVLLALCKKDNENLACIGRLGALIPLTELTKTGTDRAKRKATSLLELLSKLKVL
ncbi:U-box domain-containing protein 10-like isoform X1 [Typha latifolia]|uniref:U-box domain-containing protein 10-like isoform X1 n=2 Tax=Typha latifolia TaxID=4733 RepID=UPI003C2EF7B8